MTDRPSIPWAKPTFFGFEKDYVVDALESTWISGGPYVERLEKEMPASMGVPFGVAVSNGTAALHLALLGLGVGPGDEVIIPGFTFVAAANMVLAVGAKPVYADVNRDTWLVDPTMVASLITPKSKAIIPVHLYGNVAAMDEIGAVAKAHGIAVIEDAAEAAFSRYLGCCAGTIGDVGTLSFQATKTISTGEGGMVLTRDPRLHRRMLMLRDHGMRKGKRYWHDVVGYNFRMTNLQAALGCAQLEKLDTICRERQRVHATYRRHMAGDNRIIEQRFSNEVEPVLWTYAIRLARTAESLSRDAIMDFLGQAGIETRPGFYPMSEMRPYDCPELPVSMEVARNVILFPTYPDLDNQTIAHICETFRSILTQTP